MIIILEGIFIKLNANILSNLYGQRMKQNLREDSRFIKLLAEDNKKEQYKELFKDSKLRFTIIDRNGEVVYDTERKNNISNHLQRVEVQEALKNNEGFAIRYSETLSKKMAYYAIEVKNKFGEEYILRISKEYTREIVQIREFLLVQIVFFLILNFTIHFFYKNYIKRDFYSKIRKMKHFLQSGVKEKINYSKDEYWLFEFWDILKEWQANNLKNIQRLERERKILSQVLLSVDFFIGLLDDEGRFIIKNNVLKYVVEPSRDNYLESVKYIELITPIKLAIINKKNIREEIYIQGIKKYFMMSVKYLEFTNRFLVTIRDITTTRETVEVQKNFISNVSHELKTPLTNIKGYLIAMEDASEEMKNRFLSIIFGNVEKFENVITNFLNISKAENSNIINITQVDTKKIENDLLMIFEQKLKEKNGKLEFQFNLTDDRNYLKVDYEKLYIILKNLIENGIIYNNSKNVEIFVNVDEKPDRYDIYVKDNGIGIPISEQNKIFDRFYRVDKARTSNLGGTGLGLSIVKELIEKCGGNIIIESNEREGSKFIFEILK